MNAIALRTFIQACLLLALAVILIAVFAWWL